MPKQKGIGGIRKARNIMIPMYLVCYWVLLGILEPNLKDLLFIWGNYEICSTVFYNIK